VEAFDYKCKAFLKVSKLFEEIFTKMKAKIRNLRLFEGINNGVEALLK
jgi:hypothetical protein